MSSPLQGKVFIVTGASSGIGAATARALSAAGARVVASARRVERLRELGSVLSAGSDRWLVVEADIRDERQAEHLVADALAWGGRIDGLINNAGLSRGNIHEGSRVEDIRLILDTNVFALTNLTRLAIPELKRARGDIVNLSSVAARALTPGTAVYAASKAAVAAFSEVLRKELSSAGVRVTTIYPGLVETEFFDAFDPEKKARLEKMMRDITALRDQDLAETILFALTRPPHVALTEIVIRPTRDPL